MLSVVVWMGAALGLLPVVAEDTTSRIDESPLWGSPGMHWCSVPQVLDNAIVKVMLSLPKHAGQTDLPCALPCMKHLWTGFTSKEEWVISLTGLLELQNCCWGGEINHKLQQWLQAESV